MRCAELPKQSGVQDKEKPGSIGGVVFTVYVDIEGVQDRC